MNSVGIIGLGRFGKLLQAMFNPGLNQVKALGYDPKQNNSDPLEKVLQQENLIIATPIRDFAEMIESIAPQLKPGTTVIDVCSVKVYPVEIMQAKLPDYVDIIATHPLFGPDSIHDHHEKKIMMSLVRDQHARFKLWWEWFESNGLQVIEMTPEQHDQYMAQSQSMTHLLGRALDALPAKPTPLNTAGYTQLLTIKQHTCNDSWELFYDLQRFNPFSKNENKRLLKAIEKLMADIEANSHS